MESKIKNIEERLEQVEKSQEEYNEQLQDIIEEMKGLNVKINTDLDSLLSNNKENKTLLRELRSQNMDIVNKIIEANQKTEDREYELRKLKWLEVMKIVGTLIGSGGVIYILVEALIK